jgi:flavin reductase (DIM6/NTAB) family NADH-FMN oxidoreductase RutF
MVGMAVSSFTSASLDPPLVAFFPGKASSSWARIRGAGRFCVNILAADQEDVCRKFASHEQDKFGGVDYTMSPLGLPIIEGAIASIECELENVVDAGDHDLALGRVMALTSDGERHPLVFFKSGYGHFRSNAPTSAAGTVSTRH